MSYSLIPFLFIIIPLLVIVVVVVRKFPQLTLMDIDSLPGVREEKEKEEIMKKRAEREAEKTRKKIGKKIKPLILILKRIQLKFREYVGKIEQKAAEDENKFKVSRNMEEQEKEFLSAIKINPKDVGAYKGLAKIYAERGNFSEAKEICLFILQLEPDDAETKNLLVRLET